MSADAAPITARAFAEAISEVPLSTLHIKAAELRNSLAHLSYSNAQLEPFARPPPGSTEEADAVCIEAIEENIGVMARYRERLELLKAEAEKRGVNWEELEKQLQNVSGGAVATVEESELSPSEREALTQLSASISETAAHGARVEAAEEDRMMVDGQRVGTHSAWSDGTFQMGRINAAGDIVMDEPAASAAPASNSVTTNGVRDHDEEVNSVADVQGMTAPTTNGASARQGGRLSDEELRRRMAEQLGEDEEEGVYL